MPTTSPITFARIHYPGSDTASYINHETGVEFYKVAAGWWMVEEPKNVSTKPEFRSWPVEGGDRLRTIADARAVAKRAVADVRADIAKAYVEAVGEHIDRAEAAAQAAGATTWRAKAARRAVEYAADNEAGNWLVTAVSDVARMEANTRAQILRNTTAKGEEWGYRPEHAVEAVRILTDRHGFDPDYNMLVMGIDFPDGILHGSAVEEAVDAGLLICRVERLGGYRSYYRVAEDISQVADDVRQASAEAVATGRPIVLAKQNQCGVRYDAVPGPGTITCFRPAGHDDTIGHAPVRFPEGTPEYAAYRRELTAELTKFTAGEPPYQRDQMAAFLDAAYQHRAYADARPTRSHTASMLAGERALIDEAHAEALRDDEQADVARAAAEGRTDWAYALTFIGRRAAMEEAWVGALSEDAHRATLTARVCTAEQFAGPHDFEHDPAVASGPAWPEGYEVCGEDRDAPVHREGDDWGGDLGVVNLGEFADAAPFVDWLRDSVRLAATSVEVAVGALVACLGVSPDGAMTLLGAESTAALS